MQKIIACIWIALCNRFGLIDNLFLLYRIQRHYLRLSDGRRILFLDSSVTFDGLYLILVIRCI